MNAFPMIERAVRELIHTRMPETQGKTGIALSYDRGEGFYVWLGLLSGQTGQIEGDWVVDIDVFADDYNVAMTMALDLEAKLISPRYAVLETMRLDSITQNASPVAREWDDDKVWRIGATYSFTARRSG